LGECLKNLFGFPPGHFIFAGLRRLVLSVPGLIFFTRILFFAVLILVALLGLVLLVLFLLLLLLGRLVFLEQALGVGQIVPRVLVRWVVSQRFLVRLDALLNPPRVELGIPQIILRPVDVFLRL